MIRMGGGPGADPEAEKKTANQAIAGNAIFFGVWVAAINALPYLLDQLGFEASL